MRPSTAKTNHSAPRVATRVAAPGGRQYIVHSITASPSPTKPWSTTQRASIIPATLRQYRARCSPPRTGAEPTLGARK